MEILKKKKKLSLILLFAVLILSAVGVYVVGASVRNNNAEPVEPEIVEEDILDEDILEDDEIEDEITEDDLDLPEVIQPSPSNDMDEMNINSKPLSNEIISMVHLQNISGCDVKYTNPAMSDFSFIYDQCKWRVTTSLTTDSKRLGTTAAFNINFEHITINKKLEVMFFIPGFTGWGGPFPCYANADITKLTPNFFRWNFAVPDTHNNISTMYTTAVYDRNMPDFSNRLNSEHATLHYSETDSRRVSPNEVNWCIIHSPSMLTNNTLTPQQKERFSSSTINNPIMANISTDITDAVFLSDFDNIMKTLKF